MIIGVGTVEQAKNSGPEKYFYISQAPGLVKFNPLAQLNFLLAQQIVYYNKNWLAIKTIFFNSQNKTVLEYTR